MADVFVSYKAEDRPRVQPLVEALEADGLSVWWDAQIGAGDRWRETILKKLDSAGCVIVVWSRRSTGHQGEFVQDEASHAKRRGVYVPIRIDKCEPPLGFGETQALSLQGWKGDRADHRYQAVLRSVCARLGRAQPGSSAPETSRGISRRAAVAGGAGVVVLAAAGTSAWWWLNPGPARSNSIAVLPFENLSGDPAQAYFSDGIAEELRSALARIAGLKVVARTSSEAVRDEDAKTAARKLDVGDILTGSIRRSPAVIRISTQLIDGRDGTQLWSQDYDRAVGDTLQIQSDIAQRVAAALALRFAPAADGRLTQGGTTIAAAHDLFLRGVAARQSQHSLAKLSQAIDLFNSALEQDPSYADAYALKATTQAELSGGFSSSGAEMRRGLADAAASARQALALAPDLPAAHAALAAVSATLLDFTSAIREFAKAASATNADAVIIGDYGGFLGQIGFPDEAHAMGARAIALDPLNGRSYVPDAVAFYSARQFKDAIVAAHRVLTFHPGAPPALNSLGNSFLNLGNLKEARAAYAQMPADDVFRLTSEGILDERIGNHAASARAVEKIERMFGDASSYQLAEVQAQRGQKDAAFAALDRALRTPDPGLISLLVDPFLDPIRSDPRFDQFRHKIDFPPGLPGDGQG